MKEASSPELKRYYSIGEVAELLQVSPSTLRSWERATGAIHPVKNRRGDRRYTARDIALLRQVQQLMRQEGLTLAGVRRRLRSKNLKTEQEEIIETLKTVRDVLEDTLTLLQQIANPAAQPAAREAQNHQSSGL